MKRLAVIILLCLLVVGCNYTPIYVGVYDFEQKKWEAGQNVVFDYLTVKNQSAGEFRLSLRYLPVAVGQRVALAVKTVQSHNVYCVDTLDFVLGMGNGDRVRSAEIVVRNGVRWPTFAPHHTVVTPIQSIDNVVSLSLQIDNATKLAQ